MSYAIHPYRNAASLVAAFLLTLATAGCRGSGRNEGDVVVVNAPVAGEVRRVLVSEGAEVSGGATIIEIAVQEGLPPQPQSPAGDPQAQAQADLDAVRKEVTAAEAEVKRALVDVQRVEPLVASGYASQSELDAARARHQQAQMRLDSLREKAQRAQDNLTFQRGRGSSAPDALPREKIVPIRVTASGTVRVISARVGQRVSAGQPLATISPDNR